LKKYIVYNIFIPLLLGVLIYYLPYYFLVYDFITNFLPDGLWAYAFTSTILLIWNREINIFWLIVLGLCFVFFEILQFAHVLKGIGDVLDIIIYFLFGFFSIIMNNFYKK
jgi:hypothetical protein